MLVLSRGRDESIIIGPAPQAGIHEPIVVTVIDIRGDKVRIGIHAPRDVPVHRLEVYDAICRERLTQRSAKSAETAKTEGESS